MSVSKRKRPPPSASVSLQATVTDQPRSNGSGIGAWLANQLWNTSLLWLLGIFAIGTAFYVDTSRSLALHTATLAKLEVKTEETVKIDTADRAKVRDQFLAESKASSLGIAELNKQTAVMSAVLVGVQRELEKIGAKLDARPAVPR